MYVQYESVPWSKKQGSIEKGGLTYPRETTHVHSCPETSIGWSIVTVCLTPRLQDHYRNMFTDFNHAIWYKWVSRWIGRDKRASVLGLCSD